jgi:sulfatase modifying factor 1
VSAAAVGTAPNGMTWIPGGTFLMGSTMVDYPEEGPPHYAAVDGFWMDQTPVTNAQFRRFVKSTGYSTVAERAPDPDDFPGLEPELLQPGSLVFRPTQGPVDLTDLTAWWRFVPGASWQRPEGPRTSIAGRELHPVVHVCWEDVCAYAEWSGKQLPTEAEWELAARGGLPGATYPWGEEFMPARRLMANIWVGEFPWQNLKPPGAQRTSPVRSYPPNGFNLYDVAGNVWEWTSDFYRDQHGDTAAHACCAPVNPRVDSVEGSYEDDSARVRIPRRVIKGGSHLCAPNYCRRYRPAARQAQQVESSMSHLGFRCVLRASGAG